MQNCSLSCKAVPGGRGRLRPFSLESGESAWGSLEVQHSPGGQSRLDQESLGWDVAGPARSLLALGIPWRAEGLPGGGWVKAQLHLCSGV